MDSTELEIYQAKLDEVQLALSADPTNTELQDLKKEIEDLLQLSVQLHQDTKPKPYTKPTPAQSDAAKGEPLDPGTRTATKSKWRTGDVCMAKYRDDGVLYPARIVSVSDAGNAPFVVQFDGYGNTQECTLDELERAPKSADTQSAQGPATQGERVVQGKVEKKKKMKGKASKGPSVVASNQQAWLKFAKGGNNKKLKAKAINGKSIFKSPDTIRGRVGVTNSGKGMTKNPRITKLS